MCWICLLPDSSWYQCSIWARHWDENVAILMKFSSLAAPEVVKLTTSSAANDDNFIKRTTFPFQWMTSFNMADEISGNLTAFRVLTYSVPWTTQIPQRFRSSGLGWSRSRTWASSHRHPRRCRCRGHCPGRGPDTLPGCRHQAPRGHLCHDHGTLPYAPTTRCQPLENI